MWSLSVLLLFTLGSPAGAAPPRVAHTELDEGRAAFDRGAFESAVESWTRAARLFQEAGDHAGQIAALVHVAEGYSALGQYRQSVGVLDRALEVAEASGDRSQVPWILSRLGSVLTATGPPQAAEATLRRALGMAREAADRPLAAGLLNDLGNQLASRKEMPEALAAYRESAAVAESSGRELLVARARINEARALRQTGATSEARTALDDAFDRLDRSSPSQQAAFALVSVGVGYRELRAVVPDSAGDLLLRAARAFGRGRDTADGLGDRRTVSYAQGYLGALYEEERRNEEALVLTREAIFAAQRANAPESLYRWQWQAARLHRKMGNVDEAMAAYRAATQQVTAMRPELSVRYGESTSSFRESIGPLFLEFVDLLLRRAGEAQGAGSGGAAGSIADPGGTGRALLAEARETVEVLKVAELRDYFRDDCVDIALSRVTQLDVVSPTAAVVYPIMLADRTELLVTLPSGLRRFIVPIGEPRLTHEVRQFRRMLERRTTRQYLRHAGQLYDWLVRPIEAELVAAKIDSLVFVPDGALRTIPMGALHDGRQFLVSKYALAITPGLKLTDPRPLDRKRPRMLAVGVADSVQGFPALPEVEGELVAVRGVFGGTALLNAQFSVANIERELRTGAYTIVHIASHGEFGGDVDKTFLLAFDGKLTMDRLNQLIGLFKYRDEPLELLTLSACDTAEGDDRAALGLAGVAVKAGARSAVATLWSVNDEASAELIGDFYRELKKPSVSRAVALQRAQLKLLSDPRYQHPGFWSPFLLINNWL
jgi:CHAT domain-containing protein